MISIKKESTADWSHFGQIFPKLGLIFFDICLWLEKRGYEKVVITSIIRPKIHDSGIHETGRAMDIRLTFPCDIANELVEYINNKYPYEGGRYKTAVRHTVDTYNDAGDHIHIQCGWTRGE
jgi:hypothetical protein